MKKFVIGIVFLFAVCAVAQDEPKFEAYLGYNFSRINSGINVPAFSANGGIAEVAYNFNHFFSLAASFPASHNGNIGGFRIDQTGIGYMVGPRVNAHMGRITPFFETLLGGTRVNRSFRSPTPGSIAGIPTSDRLVNSARSFSMLAGGGLDLNINRHLAFRPIKLYYYLTRFQPIFIPGLGAFNRNRNQNNLLYSTGFNFRF